MKKFNLLVSVYHGINHLEEKIIRPHSDDYEASLGKHLIIIPFVYLAVSVLFGWIRFLAIPIEMQPMVPALPQSALQQVAVVRVSLLPWVALAIYWICYLRPRLSLLNTTARKVGYGAFTFCLMVVMGPVIFPLLVAVILLTIAIKVGLLLLGIVMWFVALFSGNPRKAEITLDDGTVVRNRKGLFGEDNYYDRDNGSRTFDRSGDIFTER